ncbi:lyase family protein [Lysobacter korlensis]|uniref:Lyase family protein n=1 Tax=Lysobacter korlensis TaxID=553636 RepID=A0ABV6RX06_9GAMM
MTDASDAAAFDWGLLEPLSRHAGPASDDALLAALVDVERALLQAWADEDGTPGPAGIAADAFDPAKLDRAALRDGTRAGGVVVIPLVEQLRRQAEAAAPGSSDWVHRGATSQDVLDSALILTAKRAIVHARGGLLAAGRRLAKLADEERSTLTVARTLGQQAGATTFGAAASSWLDGITAAIRQLENLDFPVQLGGSVGTGEAIDVLGSGTADSDRLRAATARLLELDDPGNAWHAERSPVLRIAQAAATAVASLGRYGRDLVFLSRTEIGEVRFAGGGRSSAMPHKRNPVEAVLLTANALRAPGLLATVHTAAVSSDARPAGEWHAEWQAFRGLLRLLLESAAVAAELDPVVDHEAAERSRRAGGSELLAERASALLIGSIGRDAADRLVREALDRHRTGVADFAAAVAQLAAAERPGLQLDLGDGPTLAAAGRVVDASLARFATLEAGDDQ